MISLGIDLSTSKIAIGGVRDDGSLCWHAFELNPKLRGAERLVALRRTATAALRMYEAQGAAVLVEDVWRGELGRMAAVVEEAAKATIPGAVVISLRPKAWKVWALGHGNATKDELLRFAQGLGYTGDDQDVADALCMARAASERLEKAT